MRRLFLAIEEFLHVAAAGTDRVLVMGSLIEFEYSHRRVQLAAQQDAGFDELHQHPVRSCYADLYPLAVQHVKHVIGRHMLAWAFLEQTQDAQAG